jgi:hypothetical protein
LLILQKAKLFIISHCTSVEAIVVPKNKLVSSVEELHNKFNDYLEIIKNKIKNFRKFGKENWNIVGKTAKQ